MAMKPRDAQRLREVFRGSLDVGKTLPDVEVDGADLDIRLVPERNETGIVIPYNEEGGEVFVKLDNTTLKRLRAECQEAMRIMRRAGSGERNTAYVDNIPTPRGMTRSGRA